MNRTLPKFKKFVSQWLIFLAIIENVIFFNAENFIATVVLIYGWLIIKTFVLTQNNLKYYPVSFLMILGLSMFYFVLPIPLTLLEFKAVTYNLKVPFLTFFHHFLFVNVIVFTHVLYTRISNKKNIFRSLLVRTDFYATPTNHVIWTTAILGLLALFYNYFVFNSWQKENIDRNFLFYVNSFLAQYIWMPLIIIFTKYRYPNAKIKPKMVRIIIIYSLLVSTIAIASNWRTILFSGILILTLLYSVGILFEYYKINQVLSVKKMIIFTCITIFTLGPLMDFSYAMVIARGYRTELSSVDFLKRTVKIYNDKDLLDSYKKIGSAILGDKSNKESGWNEVYLQNLVLNRFVNLKISDNCLYYASKIGFQNEKMQIELINQIQAFTPNILLRLFNIDSNKKIDTASYSIGDFLYSLAVQNPGVKGSAVISSMTGVGMAIFGYWYLIVLIPIFIVIFTMFDSFVLIRNEKVKFSYLFYLMFLFAVNYFNDRHVYVMELRFILRNYFEAVIFFLILMRLVKIFLSIFTINKQFAK